MKSVHCCKYYMNTFQNYFSPVPLPLKYKAREKEQNGQNQPILPVACSCYCQLKGNATIHLCLIAYQPFSFCHQMNGEVHCDDDDYGDNDHDDNDDHDHDVDDHHDDDVDDDANEKDRDGYPGGPIVQDSRDGGAC